MRSLIAHPAQPLSPTILNPDFTNDRTPCWSQRGAGALALTWTSGAGGSSAPGCLLTGEPPGLLLT